MDLGIIEKLAKCIVRPPRAQYKAADLGTVQLTQFLPVSNLKAKYMITKLSKLWITEV